MRKTDVTDPKADGTNLAEKSYNVGTTNGKLYIRL
eukprot:CAMPEP_0115748292 /NCGR_PEP_ID=MMETSP0272-20121206/93597_1 /TAXON_ID=71861 /ORGANISM="Scrippsiella trochoidea, Strain CCMP3099" /LENGTH=34 /DNA_ID= /DNA_START= /DNA_END= /DNA_ORIENTATION=